MFVQTVFLGNLHTRVASHCAAKKAANAPFSEVYVFFFTRCLSPDRRFPDTRCFYIEHLRPFSETRGCTNENHAMVYPQTIMEFLQTWIGLLCICAQLVVLPDRKSVSLNWDWFVRNETELWQPNVSVHRELNVRLGINTISNQLNSVSSLLQFSHERINSISNYAIQIHFFSMQWYKGSQFKFKYKLFWFSSQESLLYIMN